MLSIDDAYYIHQVYPYTLTRPLILPLFFTWYVHQVDPYTLPSRRNSAVTVILADDDEPPFIMKSVVVKSVVELVDTSGEVVGGASGVQINLYGDNVVV